MADNYFSLLCSPDQRIYLRKTLPVKPNSSASRRGERLAYFVAEYTLFDKGAPKREFRLERGYIQDRFD